MTNQSFTGIFGSIQIECFTRECLAMFNCNVHTAGRLGILHSWKWSGGEGVDFTGEKSGERIELN